MSRVGVAIDALVVVLRAQSVTVIDGPPVDSRELPREAVLMVGVSSADRSGAVISRVNDGLGMRPTQQVSVQCVAACGRGERTLAVARNGALDLAERVSDLLDADRTLGGAVALVEMSDQELTQGYSERGVNADVLVTVILHLLNRRG